MRSTIDGDSRTLGKNSESSPTALKQICPGRHSMDATVEWQRLEENDDIQWGLYPDETAGAKEIMQKQRVVVSGWQG